jgi:hypothetical protein
MSCLLTSREKKNESLIAIDHDVRDQVDTSDFASEIHVFFRKKFVTLSFRHIP